MQRREAEYRARIDAAAEITADWYVGTQTRLHCILEHDAKPLDVLAVAGWCGRGVVTRIVDVPILMQAVRFARRAQIVAGRNVVHAVEERPIAGEHETT